MEIIEIVFVVICSNEIKLNILVGTMVPTLQKNVVTTPIHNIVNNNRRFINRLLYLWYMTITLKIYLIKKKNDAELKIHTSSWMLGGITHAFIKKPTFKRKIANSIISNK